MDGRAALRFRILGPLEARDGSEVLDLGRPRQRALLALLLIRANEVISRDRLIDVLWDGDPPKAAANVVQSYVSRLRNALGREVIETRSHGYVANLDEGQLDLDRFEALLAQGRQQMAAGDNESAARSFREALGLWRGPPLVDFAYDAFAQGAIARLEELLLTALELRIDAELALGGHTILVGELEQLTTEHGPVARRPPRELIIARLVDESAELGPAMAALSERRDRLAREHQAARVTAFTSTRLAEDVLRLAARQNVDLLLIEAPSPLLESGTPDGELDEILSRAPCDVGVVALRSGRSQADPADPVLVPFGGDDNEWAAVEIGSWIADSQAATLVLTGSAAEHDDGRRDASRLLGEVALIVQQLTGLVPSPLLVAPGAAGVIGASERAGIVVLGLPSDWRRSGLGPARVAIAREADVPVLLVKRGVRPGGLAPAESLSRFTWTLAAGDDP